jgi:hypothetical protein
MALLNNKRVIMPTGKRDQEQSSQTPATNEAVQDTAEEEAAREKAAKEKAAKDAAVKKSVQDMYSMLRRAGSPEALIPIVLEVAEKGLKHINKTKAFLKIGGGGVFRAWWSQASIATFQETLIKDPATILRDKHFVDIIKLPNLWTTIGTKSDEVASLMTSLMALPKTDGPAISELVKNFAESFGPNISKETIVHLATLLSLDEKDNDQKKKDALFALFEKATSDTALKFLQPHKQVIGKLAQKYMPAGLDAEKILYLVLTQETFASLKQVVDTKTIESLLVLTSATKQDNEKEEALLYLAEKATSTASLQLLLPYKQILIEQAKNYLPVEMDAEKILNGIMTEEAFTVLNKAVKEYRYHRGNGNKTFGLLKAVAIVMTCPELARVTTHVLWRSLKTKLLNLVPDFIRRIYANDKVNDILSKRGDNKDLNNLCASSFASDPITRNILGSRCFKGLDIPHNLDDLVISGFDFKRATFGMTKDEAQSKGKNANFSFANSVISKSDFKDVTFVGPIIDLSGMQIDSESFNSLLPALQKAKLEGKKIEMDTNIKIKGEVQDIASKMEALDCKGKFTPVESLDKASKEKSSQKPEHNPSKSKPDKEGPSLV